ncbi:nucleotidyltransferase family protein [Sulfurovum sp. CS9]|uniref:nucleotidyltransferase family protein n=1 Tax=Sulfurovum sp. CS9 TaxID=3391146 RepID=UPI0039EC1782
MITVVLLAAGKSSRTSTVKQLYPVKGEYLINIQIRKLHAYGFDVAVVLGHEYKKIRTVLDNSVTIVHNENYEEGMFSSVKKVFETLDEEQLIFCHIDRPIPDLAVFEALLQSEKAISVAFYQGEKAPPIRIKSSMKKHLLNSNLKRLDHWIAAEDDVDYLEVDDPKVHYNANTDETLKRYFDE